MFDRLMFLRLWFIFLTLSAASFSRAMPPKDEKTIERVAKQFFGQSAKENKKEEIRSILRILDQEEVEGVGKCSLSLLKRLEINVSKAEVLRFVVDIPHPRRESVIELLGVCLAGSSSKAKLPDARKVLAAMGGISPSEMDHIATAFRDFRGKDFNLRDKILLLQALGPLALERKKFFLSQFLSCSSNLAKQDSYYSYGKNEELIEALQGTNPPTFDFAEGFFTQKDTLKERIELIKVWQQVENSQHQDVSFWAKKLMEASGRRTRNFSNVPRLIKAFSGVQQSDREGFSGFASAFLGGDHIDFEVPHMLSAIPRHEWGKLLCDWNSLTKNFKRGSVDSSGYLRSFLNLLPQQRTAVVEFLGPLLTPKEDFYEMQSFFEKFGSLHPEEKQPLLKAMAAIFTKEAVVADFGGDPHKTSKGIGNDPSLASEPLTLHVLCRALDTMRRAHPLDLDNIVRNSLKIGIPGPADIPFLLEEIKDLPCEDRDEIVDFTVLLTQGLEMRGREKLSFAKNIKMIFPAKRAPMVKIIRTLKEKFNLQTEGMTHVMGVLHELPLPFWGRFLNITENLFSSCILEFFQDINPKSISSYTSYHDYHDHFNFNPISFFNELREIDPDDERDFITFAGTFIADEIKAKSRISVIKNIIQIGSQNREDLKRNAEFLRPLIKGEEKTNLMMILAAVPFCEREPLRKSLEILPCDLITDRNFVDFVRALSSVSPLNRQSVLECVVPILEKISVNGVNWECGFSEKILTLLGKLPPSNSKNLSQNISFLMDGKKNSSNHTLSLMQVLSIEPPENRREIVDHLNFLIKEFKGNKEVFFTSSSFIDLVRSITNIPQEDRTDIVRKVQPLLERIRFEEKQMMGGDREDIAGLVAALAQMSPLTREAIQRNVLQLMVAGPTLGCKNIILLIKALRKVHPYDRESVVSHVKPLITPTMDQKSYYYREESRDYEGRAGLVQIIHELHPKDRPGLVGLVKKLLSPTMEAREDIKRLMEEIKKIDLHEREEVVNLTAQLIVPEMRVHDHITIMEIIRNLEKADRPVRVGRVADQLSHDVIDHNMQERERFNRIIQLLSNPEAPFTRQHLAITGQEAMMYDRDGLENSFRQLMNDPEIGKVIKDHLPEKDDSLENQYKDFLTGLTLAITIEKSDDIRFRFLKAKEGLNRLKNIISPVFGIANMPTIRQLFGLIYNLLNHHVTLTNFVQTWVAQKKAASPEWWGQFEVVFAERFPETLSHSTVADIFERDRIKGGELMAVLTSLIHGLEEVTRKEYRFVKEITKDYNDAFILRNTPLIEALMMSMRGHNVHLLDSKEPDKPACTDGVYTGLLMSLKEVRETSTSASKSLPAIEILRCA